MFFSFKDKSKNNIKIFLIFIAYFIAIQIASYLPFLFNFFNEKMNWSGKIYSIIVSLIFLILYKGNKIKDYYLTLSQNKKEKRKVILITFCLFVLVLLLGNKSKPINFNLEKLTYQMTIPGIDEELAYRGIMLSLLSQIFIPYFKLGRIIKVNPAILVTSILFGLIHSLFINNNFELNFNSYSFVVTFLFGYTLGYITILTKSILLPLVIHNTWNTILQIFKMFIN